MTKRLMVIAALLAAAAAPAQAATSRMTITHPEVAPEPPPQTPLTPEEIQYLIELRDRLAAQQAAELTPRERCYKQELASLGTRPNRLALRAIDLKCSQR